MMARENCTLKLLDAQQDLRTAICLHGHHFPRWSAFVSVLNLTIPCKTLSPTPGAQGLSQPVALSSHSGGFPGSWRCSFPGLLSDPKLGASAFAARPRVFLWPVSQLDEISAGALLTLQVICFCCSFRLCFTGRFYLILFFMYVLC